MVGSAIGYSLVVDVGHDRPTRAAAGQHRTYNPGRATSGFCGYQCATDRTTPVAYVDLRTFPLPPQPRLALQSRRGRHLSRLSWITRDRLSSADHPEYSVALSIAHRR